MLLTSQIRTKWIPLVNGEAEKGNKYVHTVVSMTFALKLVYIVLA